MKSESQPAPLCGQPHSAIDWKGRLAMGIINKPALALFAAFVASALVLGKGPPDQPVKPKTGATTEKKHGYAPVNGLKVYYEIHGAADGNTTPLVLLHGGGSTIETSFGKVLPSFAKTRQVIAFEQQGHGHTADIVDRPFSFEQSADDAAALMQYISRLKEPTFSATATEATSLCRSPSDIRTRCANWWSPPPCSRETGSIPSFGNR